MNTDDCTECRIGNEFYLFRTPGDAADACAAMISRGRTSRGQPIRSIQSGRYSFARGNAICAGSPFPFRAARR